VNVYIYIYAEAILRGWRGSQIPKCWRDPKFLDVTLICKCYIFLLLVNKIMMMMMMMMMILTYCMPVFINKTSGQASKFLSITTPVFTFHRHFTILFI